MKRFVLATLALSITPAAGAFAQTRYVSSCGFDSQVGYTDNCSAPNPWERPVRTIQRAIEVLPNGGEIVVFPGTYPGEIDLGGKNYVIRSVGGPAVTTISGDGAGLGFLMIGGQSSQTVIDGFMITGFNGVLGGGMKIVEGSPTVVNCEFASNSADLGGAIYVDMGTPEISRCVFRQNVASTTGSGIFAYGPGHLKVDACTFLNNFGSVGRAIRTNIPATITNCVFLNNLVDGGSVISNDQPGAEVSILNCSFYESGPTSSGTYIASALATVAVRNCILWGIGTPLTQAPGQGSTVVSHSDVQGGYAGTGNINVNPGFVNPAGGDLHLQSMSPCVDAADAVACALAGVTTDFDGGMRGVNLPAVADAGVVFWGQAVDMGAFELPGAGDPAACPADLTHDGVVSGLDLASLLAAWGSCK